MVETRGKVKGSKKTGGAVKGSIRTQTKAVKEAVKTVFDDINQGGAYLRMISETQPNLFLSLVSKLIPNSVDLEITHKVDLSQAMIDAQARLDHPDLINVTPSVSQPVEALGTPAELTFDGYASTVARQPRGKR